MGFRRKPGWHKQTCEGKPDGSHYSEHRTVDSKNNVIVNVHAEPANINDMTPVPTVLKEIEQQLGHLPKYMGFDAGYHSAGIAHLLENKDIQAVILANEAKGTGYVFGGESPLCYSAANRLKKRAFDHLGIEGFNNHDFRTTLGT